MKKYVFLIIGKYINDDNDAQYEWRLEILDIVGMHHYLKTYVEILSIDPSESFIIVCNLEKVKNKPYMTEISSKDFVPKYKYLTKLVTDKMCPISVSRFFVICDKIIELNKEFEEIINNPKLTKNIDAIMDSKYKYKSSYYDAYIHDFNILDICRSSIQEL